MKRYLLLFSSLFFVLFISVAVGVVFVDPYGLFRYSDNDYFPRKTSASNKGRLVKSYQVEGQQIETLIIGNSRVEIGMPQNHFFYGKSVFNIGLPGAGLLMQYDYGWHAVKSSKGVKKVLIAVDFVDFLSKEGIEISWRGQWQSRLKYQLPNGEQVTDNKIYRAKEFLSFLFSQDAIIDSILTVITQRKNINSLSYNGFNDGRLYIDLVSVEGYGSLYKQKNVELRQRLSEQSIRFNIQSDYFLMLEKFVSLLQSENIEVIIFVNPYQEPYLDIVNEAGFKLDLERWKVRIKQLASQKRVDFYDFSILSLPVRDVAPLNSRNPNDNEYFWEPAHYKQKLGTLMLDAIQHKDCDHLIDQRKETICIYQRGE